MKIRLYMLLLFPVIFLCSACEEWLDVKPKSQIESAVLFEAEAGFKDALAGIYMKMTEPAMYGREMTFGVVDVLGAAYSTVGSVIYTPVRNYDYTHQDVEPVINRMWQNTYNTIANVNSLIKNLLVAEKGMFSTDNYEVILGEAYGLRGFLHFDLLRLFAPSYLAGATSLSIPYVTEYSFKITPEHAVSVVIDSVLNDLQRAASLLQQSDPMVTGRTITYLIDDNYLSNRKIHLNYYAIKALMARVYLYKGDKSNAAQCAEEIIASRKFSWTRVDNIAVSVDARRDRTFSTEHVFALDIQKMEENITGRLRETTSNAYLLTCNTAYLNRVFPSLTDWRRLYFWTPQSSSQNYHTKLWQPEGMPDTLTCRMPMVRLPELYLISAEASLPGNPAKARTYLAELKTNRGIENWTPVSTTAESLQEEIVQEYLREFIAEGVMFFMYKRLDAGSIFGASTAFNKSKYVLPMPMEEIEFGQRNTN